MFISLQYLCFRGWWCANFIRSMKRDEDMRSWRCLDVMDPWCSMTRRQANNMAVVMTRTRALESNERSGMTIEFGPSPTRIDCSPLSFVMFRVGFSSRNSCILFYYIYSDYPRCMGYPSTGWWSLNRSQKWEQEHLFLKASVIVHSWPRKPDQQSTRQFFLPEITKSTTNTNIFNVSLNC